MQVMADGRLQERLTKLSLIDAISDSPLDLGEYLDYAIADLRAFEAHWHDDSTITEPNAKVAAPFVRIWIRAGLGHLEDAKRRYDIEHAGGGGIGSSESPTRSG